MISPSFHSGSDSRCARTFWYHSSVFGSSAFAMYDFLSLNTATGVVTLTDLRAVHEGSGENGDVSEGAVFGGMLLARGEDAAMKEKLAPPSG